MQRFVNLFALAAFAACAQAPGGAGVSPVAASVVHRHQTTTWFEEQFARATSATPDGQRVVFEARGTAQLIDARYGALPMERWAGVDAVTGVTIRPTGDVAVRGQRGDSVVWVDRDGSGSLRTIDISPTARPVWGDDGSSVAYQEVTGSQWMLHIVRRGSRRAVPLPVRASAIAWYPDASAVLVMLPDRDGTSALYRMDISRGALELLVRALDAPATPTSIAISRDGRDAYVALASATTPMPDERHMPYADRDLDIYAVDLATGARRVIASTPGDDAFPFRAGGVLYWTATRTDASVVVLPAGGGVARRVADSAQMPTWHPNGRQIGFTYGHWRMADWPLNWDGGTVQVDTAGRPTAAPGPLIVGYHEDFSPTWSPNGRWMAYHSHRTRDAVTSAMGTGGADDIFLRAAGAPLEAEIRLTTTGRETGSPDWSPDGTRLVFTSFESANDRVRSMAHVVTLDTTQGRAVSVTRVPLPPEIASAEMVAWSPRGDSLAIEAAMTPDRHALWVMHIAGTGARKLVDYPMRTYGGVDWMPDGSALIYPALSGGRMQLFTIPARGGLPLRLTSDDGHLLHPQVSPDGRHIAATRLVHHIEVRRMPLVP